MALQVWALKRISRHVHTPFNLPSRQGSDEEHRGDEDKRSTDKKRIQRVRQSHAGLLNLLLTVKGYDRIVSAAKHFQ